MKPIQELYGEHLAVLCLNLTNTCDVQCAHCGVSSGPWKSPSLDLASITPSIARMAREGHLRGLHVSGGEPFVYRRDLAILSDVARGNQLLLAVNTNAHWARDLKVAGKVLAPLTGLSQLIVSTDVFHESYIPLDRVRNAVVAALERALIVQIAVCEIRGDANDVRPRLVRALGEEVLANVKVGVNGVEPYGRGETVPGARFELTGAAARKMRCGQVCRPAVLEDGTVHACCNVAIAKKFSKSLLHLGNVRDKPLDEIIAAARKSNLIDALRCLGPGYLLSLLRGTDQGQPPDDFCGLCAWITSSPERSGIVQDALRRPEVRWTVASAKFAIFGDDADVRDLIAGETDEPAYRPEGSVH